MTAPKYAPHAWLDEIMPAPLARPEDFVEKDGDRWFLRLPEDDLERDNEFYITEIEPGQTVDFLIHENYGQFELSIGADRRFTTDRPFPDKANGFWIPFDPETMQHSLRGLVEGDGDFALRLEAGEHVIGIYWWSEPTPFRFEIDEAGQPRFVASAGPN